jgi:phage-related minor tail protein
MTIEAKLKITPELQAATAALKQVTQDITGVAAAAKTASAVKPFEGVAQSAKQAEQAVKQLAREQAVAAAAADKQQRNALFKQTQLGYQLNDFFVQVSSGQSPLTALVQQGSQLSGTFGGLGGAFKAVTGLLSPLVVGAGLATAAVGALGFAFYQGGEQSKAFNRSLVLTGGYAGVTAGAVDAMAQRISTSVGTSIGGARETIAALISTGRFTGQALEPVAGVIEKVTALTGTSREEVIKNFSEMASGGVLKFAEAANKTYNFLDLATYRYIKQLEEQGRATEAMRVVSEALNGQLGGVSNNLGTLERAWRGVKNYASQAWDAMLGVGREKTIEQQIEQAQSRQQAFKGIINDPSADARRANRGQGGESEVDSLRRTAAEQARVASQKAERAQSNEKRIQAEKDFSKLLDAAASKTEKRDKELKKARTDAALNGASAADLAKVEGSIRDKYKETGGASQTLTRQAQAKAVYDKDLELASDANTRAKKLLQERFDTGLVDLQSYLREKARLEENDAAQDIARIQKKIAEEQRALADNQARAKSAKSANDKEQFANSITTGQQKIDQLQVDLAKRERDRLDAARGLTGEAEKYSRELRDQLATIQTQLAQGRGNESESGIARRVQAQYQPQINREFDLGGDGGATQSLADLKIRQEVLAARERALAQATGSLRLKEDAVRIAQDAGTVSAEQAEGRILALRREQLPVLQQLLDAQRALASSPEETSRADQAQLELDRLKDQRTELGKFAKNEATSGLSTFFTEVTTGAKSAGDALRDMVGNFAKQMLSLLAQKMGEKLINSFLPSAGGGGGGGGGGGILDGIGGLLASVFHSGGVVGDAGAASRSVPAGLASYAASYAPRYHSGGIAGFKPNERLAVLEEGEEVLTANDPRHVANYSAQRGGMQINTSVSVTGAQGNEQRNQSEGDNLSRQINNMIDQWAVNQSRPGGILARA